VLNCPICTCQNAFVWWIVSSANLATCKGEQP